MDPQIQELIATCAREIEQPQPETQTVLATLDRHLQRVAEQLVATDQMMGQCNFDAPDEVFERVVKANIDTVKKEFKSLNFGLEFAKKIVTNSTPTDCPVLNTACQTLKIGSLGLSSVVWMAECVRRSNLIVTLFTNTLGNEDMWTFIIALVEFMKEPTNDKYEEFKTSHPIPFAILSSVADVATKENFIFIAHICLSKWANPEPASVPPPGGAAAAPPPGGAAAAPPPGGAAAPPPGSISDDIKQKIIAYGISIGKKALSTTRAVLTIPSSCLLGFGWQPAQYVACTLDAASAWALSKTTMFLQAQDIPFQQFMMRVYTSMRFAGCYDAIGSNPRLVSICVMGLRSNKRQQILEILTRKMLLSQAVDELKMVYTDCSLECPTNTSLDLLEQELDGIKQTKLVSGSGDSFDSDAAHFGSQSSEANARLRDLLLDERVNWTYIDFVKEIAADAARMLALDYLQPAISTATVASRFEEPVAKVNPILMDPTLVTKVSSLLPQQQLLEQMFNDAKEELVTKLSNSSKGLITVQQANIIAENCKKHIMWAWSNQRQIVMQDGKPVYMLVGDPDPDVENHIKEYNYEVEEKKLKKVGITHRGIFGFFRYACTKTATAAQGLASIATQVGTRFLRGQAPGLNEVDLDRQDSVNPSELVPALIAFPPPTSSVDSVVAVAADVVVDDNGECKLNNLESPGGGAAQSDDIGLDGGRSRSRKRSASKRTRRKAKQSSKKLKRKSRRYVRHRRSTRRKN